MVAISFNVLKLKKMILEGKKKQTIRLYNEKWTNVYRKFEHTTEVIKLQLYWKQRSQNNELLMTTELKSIEPIFLGEIDKKIAIADGFDSIEECKDWFKKTYKKVDFNSQLLALIKW